MNPLVVAGLSLCLSTCGTWPGPTWTHDDGAVVRADPTRRELALAFTGGDFGEGTGHVLDVLDRVGVRASFFLTGDFIGRAGQRSSILRMVAGGHYVGPHSDGHLLYCAWEDRQKSLIDEGAFRIDLSRNIADLRRFGALAEGEPIYFIPPYEWFNRDQVAWAAAMGVTLFNFTPGTGSNRDWIPEDRDGFVPSRKIRDDILAWEESQPSGLNGFFLLLHLGSERRDKMHLQLEPLLVGLLARGYSFVTVDELLAR